MCNIRSVVFLVMHSSYSRGEYIIFIFSINLVGVITDDDTDAEWGGMELVDTLWSELRYQKSIFDLDVEFIPIRRRTELTMDILIEGI